jgi:hypothetical protein
MLHPAPVATALRSITAPGLMRTRIGTLKFFDGLPDADSIQTVFPISNWSSEQ